MSSTEQSVQCAKCGQVLSLQEVGPCPSCGGTGKTYGVASEIESPSAVRLSLGWKQVVREYYEKHPVWLPLEIGISIGSPFMGLWLAGWEGVGAGLVVSLIALAIGKEAMTKVRVEHEGKRHM